MTRRSRSHEIPDIVAQLASRSRPRVDAARARLSIVGARATEALIEALEGDNTRIRRRVMPLLALIQDSRGRGPLIAMLLDRKPGLRATAARSLARFPAPDAVAALGRVLQRDVSVKVRIAAAQALVELYSAGQEQAIGHLLDVLMDTDTGTPVRVAALDLIPALHPSQRKGVLARLEKDGNAELLAALERKRNEAETSDSHPGADLSDLLRDLASEDYSVWNTAVHRLSAHGARMVSPLIAEMQSRSHDPEYCARAGMALKTLGPRRGRAIADALETVEAPLPLQILVEVIGALGVKAMIYRLKDLVDTIADKGSARAEVGDFDPMQRVRAKAHLELARIGSRVAIEDLRNCLRDGDRRLELEILGALELIGNRGEIGLLLSVHAREDDFMRQRIGDVVRTIMKRERIRRNDRLFAALGPRQRQALLSILPPVRPRRARPRRSSPPARKRVKPL